MNKNNDVTEEIVTEVSIFVKQNYFQVYSSFVAQNEETVTGNCNYRDRTHLHFYVARYS